jgi:hypothetical protein
MREDILMFSLSVCCAGNAGLLTGGVRKPPRLSLLAAILSN